MIWTDRAFNSISLPITSQILFLHFRIHILDILNEQDDKMLFRIELCYREKDRENLSIGYKLPNNLQQRFSGIFPLLPQDWFEQCFGIDRWEGRRNWEGERNYWMSLLSPVPKTTLAKMNQNKRGKRKRMDAYKNWDEKEIGKMPEGCTRARKFNCSLWKAL